ncbi:patatin-like phospholipase family protein [Chryseobacterium chendengshani]|uniref:patatin-like phospholipase family protein n=1 Tax=Chryseobacterium sp. LJ668 TaxID=2864040 RepID=UPI001C68D078|nr:patatin-like phospholipase family protein [Chryseobacterium sp. LJ668]MBW8523886.1 patatin-like phospholipase family protein [Chryseobacterium sp. LJ668]QYK16826.1 patatin-like phospholipase family protein [Chryseobacterium sp. LJ668]
MKTEILQKILGDDVLSQESKEKLSALHENISKKEFSDILDAEGNQYIEFVQEGGGVWGSALVGYMYALEIFGIRFLKIAGTSAGAINTMLIAACKTKEEAKGEVIKDILFNWDFSDFIDGKPYVRSTIHAMLNNKNFIKINSILLAITLIILIAIPFVIETERSWQAKLWFLVPIIPLIIIFFIVRKFYNDFKKSNSGLNPGTIFLKQMTAVMNGFGIKTVAELNEKFIQKEYKMNLNYRYGNGLEFYTNALNGIEDIKMNNLEHIDETRYRIFFESAENNDYYKNNPFYQLQTEYIVITADINAKIKVELPTMANLYWSEEELKHISPAEFVRASMSVPFFFEPMQKLINKDDESVQYAWKFWMNIQKEDIYPVGIFIDGGTLSNFPIDLFHMNDIFYPRLPLFGVQLTSDSEILGEKGKTSEQILKTPLSYAGNIIGTLKGFNDKTFLTKYSFYNLYSIKTVNCGTSSWLNFFMKREEKEQLFNAGFLAALDFLNQFDWSQYKCERMMVAMKEKKILKEEDTKTVG